MKTYKEAGKLRKQCPSCKVYLHSRSGYCDCGYEFIPGTLAKLKEKETAKHTEYNTRGRGKKQCPKCRKYFGLRITQCNCGFDFATAAVVKAEKATEVPLSTQANRKFAEKLGYSNLRIVLTPAGKVPVKLKGSIKKVPHQLKKQIFGWCEELEDYAIGNRFIYAKSAIKYFARTLELDKKCMDYIDQWVASYVDSDIQSSA